MLIADLNQRVRQGKLNINNAIAYLIGIYQKKGILPTKEQTYVYINIYKYKNMLI